MIWNLSGIDMCNMYYLIANVIWDIACIWYDDKFLTKECNKSQFSDFDSWTISFQIILAFVFSKDGMLWTVFESVWKSRCLLPTHVHPGAELWKLLRFFFLHPFMRKLSLCQIQSISHLKSQNSCWVCSRGGGGYFGLRSYGDVPTFRVDFLTQNILDRVQIWVSTKC